MNLIAVDPTQTPTSSIAVEAEPARASRDVAPAPASSTGRFWYAFGRWLAVSPSVEEEFVLA